MGFRNGAKAAQKIEEDSLRAILLDVLMKISRKR